METGIFAAGLTLATPGAWALGVDLAAYVRRHVAGDWGTLGNYAATELTPAEDAGGAGETSDDAKLNLHAIRHGGRVLSAYETPRGRLWVLTDGLAAGGQGRADTLTTCLTPEES